jgi:chromosome segregation ATPase
MLKSHNAGFETVVKMIDGMVANNAKEQKDDDEKRDFCNAELLKTEDHETALKGDISDLSADLEEKEDAVATLASEIKALQQGVNDLDKSVVEATEQRKDEHAEFLSTAAANQAALELIKMATNRMNKFYQPSLYKAPPTTTVEDSPYGFVQLSLRKAEPGAAPETFEGDYKKSEGSTGIIAMMNQMSKDVEMDIQDGKHEEETAQKDYEGAMKDAATKRSDDSKLMVEKNGAKADQQTNAQSVRAERGTKREQLNIAQDKLYDLHVDCNHVLQNYDESKANRAKENDMLSQAKSVLSGASYN